MDKIEIEHNVVMQYDVHVFIVSCTVCIIVYTCIKSLRHAKRLLFYNNFP